MMSVKQISTMPSTTGVYILANKQSIIYIGKAVNIKVRLRSHLQNQLQDNKERSLMSETTDISYFTTISEFDALLLEAKLIQKYKPKYNVVWKDDKSFLYIKISIKEKYPKIYLVRHENDSNSRYFGPFQSTKIGRKILNLLRQSIPFCQASKISKRACFYSQINLCNPCPNYITKLKKSGKTHEALILTNKYRANINMIIRILECKSDLAIKKMENELSECIDNQNYEKAIDCRNSLYILKSLASRSFSEIDGYNATRSINYQQLIGEFLNNYFRFNGDKKHFRIECYDISNLFDRDVVASRVVFINEESDKKEYRRYKIDNFPSDSQRLLSVIKRRFSKEKNLPDLLIVDGGKQQLAPIKKYLNHLNINIPLIGIVKNPDRIISSENFTQIPFSSNDLFYRLIQHIRDESHRFAKKYHLLLRRKKILI